VGPYCTFCHNRCYVYRVLPDGSWSGLMATCRPGMDFDQDQTGYTHETAVNPDDPAAAARALARGLLGEATLFAERHAGAGSDGLHDREHDRREEIDRELAALVPDLLGPDSKQCARCGTVITDPWNAPHVADALCYRCGDDEVGTGADDAINGAAEFQPMRNADERPALRNGGALVFAYWQNGTLRISIDTSDVELPDGGDCCPVEVNVDGIVFTRNVVAR